MSNDGRSVFTPQSDLNKPELKIYCDGRCRRHNNVPMAAWAFCVKDAKGNVKIERKGGYENRKDITHIDAEYQAVIEGLRWAVAHADGASIEVCTNLELIEQQVSGKWKINEAKLLPLCNEVRDILQKTNGTLRWIPKKRNKHAHRLSRSAYRVGRKGEAAL